MKTYEVAYPGVSEDGLLTMLDDATRVIAGLNDTWWPGYNYYGRPVFVFTNEVDLTTFLLLAPDGIVKVIDFPDVEI